MNRVDKDVKKYEKTRITKLLGISTFALLAFGIFAQVLSEMMGYTPMLDDYFLYLLPTVIVGFWYTLLWCVSGTEARSAKRF